MLHIQDAILSNNNVSNSEALAHLLSIQYPLIMTLSKGGRLMFCVYKLEDYHLLITVCTVDKTQVHSNISSYSFNTTPISRCVFNSVMLSFFMEKLHLWTISVGCGRTRTHWRMVIWTSYYSIKLMVQSLVQKFILGTRLLSCT